MRRTIEIQTPLLPDPEKYVAGLARLEDFSALVLEESGGISSIALANMIRQRCDKQILLKITCRDRNRIALHSDLLTAASMGFSNIVLVDGTHPVHTRLPAAKPVYELDSLNLLRMLKQNSPSFGDESISPLASLVWTIGVCIGGPTQADMNRARKFAAAGADSFFPLCFDAVPQLRRLTDKQIFLSIPEEQVTDISATLRQAEAAGADGVNLVVTRLDKVLDGNIAARQ